MDDVFCWRRARSAALSGCGALALTMAGAAFANPGMGGTSGGEDHHHDSTPKVKPSGGGCGGGCGGGGSSEPDPRLRDAARDAGNRARSTGDTGNVSISTGGGRASEDATGSIAQLGAAEEAAEQERRNRRQDSLDILSAINSATNKAAGRSGLRIPDAHDVAVTAANVGHRIDGLTTPSAGSNSPPPSGTAKPAASTARNPWEDYAGNMLVIDAVTDAMAGKPVDMDEPMGGMPAPISRNELLGWKDGGSGGGTAPAALPPSGKSPQTIDAPPTSSTGKAPLLGDTSKSATAVPPTAPAPAASTWVDLPPVAADPPAAPAPEPDPPAQENAVPSPPPAAPPPSTPDSEKTIIDGYKSKEQQLKDLLAEE